MGKKKTLNPPPPKDRNKTKKTEEAVKKNSQSNSMPTQQKSSFLNECLHQSFQQSCSFFFSPVCDYVFHEAGYD